MRLPLIVSPTLMLVAAAAAEPTATATAAATGPQPYYSSAASEPVKLEGVADAKQVGKARLFVTSDGGRTWKLSQEIAVPEGAAQVPEFAFAAAADGTYGLATSATSRAGKAEPDPQPGTPPRSVLVVDRTAPALGRLDARLAAGATGEALAAGGKAPLQVEWSVSDANLLATDPVTVETSIDGGKTFAALGKGAASGTLAADVSPGKDVREVQVRVQARDLAGNVLTSAASSILLPLPPKPANPDEMLAVAVKGLPTPGELGVGTRSTAAVLPPAEQDQPVTAKAGGKTEAQGKTAKGDEPAKEPAKVAAKEPAKTEPAIAPPRPVASDGAKTDESAPADNPDRGNPTQKPSREQPSRPPIKAKRGVTPEEGVAFLVGEEARQAFAEAQDLEKRKLIDDALDAYLRLHVSSLAKQAVAAELRLLRERGDHETIVGLVDSLPAELRIDEAWLEQGRAYAQLNRHEDALTSLARIRRDAPQAREGLLALARSLKALGRAEDAKRVYAKLAGGNDSISAAARAEM